MPFNFAAVFANWPDDLNSAAVLVFLTLSIAAPLIGYCLMFLDIRAYLRALRGVRIIAKNHLPHLPE